VRVLNFLRKEPVAILFLAIPLVFLAEIKHWNPIVVFAISALGVIPAAHYIGKSTEALAHYTGPRIGGLLNATLGNAAELLAVAAQLDADGAAGMRVPAHEGRRPGAERAAQVLAALEQLGAALVRRGLRLAERTGLGRVLAWQHTAHGDVYGLVAGRLRLSPAMAPGGGRPMR